MSDECETISDPYCIDGLREVLDAGHDLERRQQIWLLRECERLHRANVLLDAAAATHDAEIAAMNAEAFGYQSELGDVQDKLTGAELELEILRYACGRAT